MSMIETIIHLHPNVPIKITGGERHTDAGCVDIGTLFSEQGRAILFIHAREDRHEVATEIARLLNGGAVRPELSSEFTGLGTISVSADNPHAQAVLAARK